MKHILAGLAAFTLSLASANADPTTPKAPTQRDWENHLSTRLAVENPELRPTLVQIINGRGYDCRRIDMIWRANDDIDYTDFIIGCDTGQGPPYHTYELEFGKSGHWVLRSPE